MPHCKQQAAPPVKGAHWPQSSITLKPYGALGSFRDESLVIVIIIIKTLTTLMRLPFGAAVAEKCQKV